MMNQFTIRWVTWKIDQFLAQTDYLNGDYQIRPEFGLTSVLDQTFVLTSVYKKTGVKTKVLV